MNDEYVEGTDPLAITANVCQRLIRVGVPDIKLTTKELEAMDRGISKLEAKSLLKREERHRRLQMEKEDSRRRASEIRLGTFHKKEGQHERLILKP